MPPNMSFAITTDQVCKRIKYVTRRTGWNKLKCGDLFWAVEKGMGLKKGEKIKRISLCKCISNRREPLSILITNPSYGEFEMNLEGFPGMDPADFIVMFMKTHKGTTPESEVNRIQFVYLDE